MDEELVKAIYENVKQNAIRYWARTWLIKKLYHDKDLCDLANNSTINIENGYHHIRESLIDSSVISLSKGFLDSGDDSLSIIRLFPHSSEFLINKKPKRIVEGEEACEYLYSKWYINNNTDGKFIKFWLELIELIRDFRKLESVQNVLNLRNYTIAHALDIENEVLPTFTDLHALRENLVIIMNKLSLLVECENTEWHNYMNDTEGFSMAVGRALEIGINSIDAENN